jgi:hypothetical protein
MKLLYRVEYVSGPDSMKQYSLTIKLFRKTEPQLEGVLNKVM